MIVGPLELQLCDIQGRLFELSLGRGFDSEKFIDLYMRSKCAEGYDMRHNRLQWMGEEYMMEELVDEQGGRLATGRQYQREAMYWIGYIYRYWHFITGESSRRISMRAPAKVMAMGYPGFHTEDAALAIDDLMRVAKERGRPHQKRGGR